MPYSHRVRLVREMVAILLSRGYTHPKRLFHLVEDHRDKHRLEVWVIRQIIHEAKTK